MPPTTDGVSLRTLNGTEEPCRDGGKAENFPVKKTCSRNKTVRLVCNEKAGVGLAAGMGR